MSRSVGSSLPTRLSNHKAEEYARIDSGTLVTTNTVEGFFGNSKRSIDGTHHHISRQHINLYFAELDYKYNTAKRRMVNEPLGLSSRLRGSGLCIGSWWGSDQFHCASS